MASKIKTKEENGRVNSFNGELKICAETKGWKQKVELWLLNDQVNRNDWQYLNLEDNKDQFAETPLLVAYVGNKIGDGHNFDEYQDRKTGETRASFLKSTAERIVGYFRDTKDIRIVEKDGVKWVVGIAYIWRWYAQELVDYLKEQGLEGMPVSIETLVTEMHNEGITEVFTKYQILGTTILGKDVAPAVKDANIRVLQAIGAKDVRELTLKVASKEAESKKSATKTDKGDKTKSMPKILNIANVREKFNELGYTALAVNGCTVALMANETHCPYTYTFGENEETVVPENITAVKVNAIFGDGEESVSVDVESIVGDTNAKLDAATVALNNAVTENANLKNEISAMKNAEKERRKEAVKDTIKSRVASNGKTFDGKIAENLCDDLMSDECLGRYADMECDGKWIGNERAIADVDARCMQALRNKQEEIIAKNTRKYAWDNLGADNAGKNSDGVSGSISRILK